MNRDDVIRMAREAFIKRGFWPNEVMWECWKDAWIQGAAAAVEREREACAKLVEPDEEHRRDAAWGYLGGKEGVELLDSCAAAIRARGETLSRGQA